MTAHDVVARARELPTQAYELQQAEYDARNRATHLAWIGTALAAGDPLGDMDLSDGFCPRDHMPLAMKALAFLAATKMRDRYEERQAKHEAAKAALDAWREQVDQVARDLLEHAALAGGSSESAMTIADWRGDPCWRRDRLRRGGAPQKFSALLDLLEARERGLAREDGKKRRVTA